MNSSDYNPNSQPHPSRVSPVMESEEDYVYDTDDYSSINNHPNGEAYMVTDVYHQPIPLPGSSDSGPEYSTPFVNNHSPGSMRHVFSPATTATAASFQAGSKQKPRMGVMAARGMSDKNPKASDLRNYSPEDSENPYQDLSDEENESPVYDSTQYIVTPTRRRNSENDKSSNGRSLLRRDPGAGLEYPEVRGRLGEDDELPAVPPGVVLLQSTMFQEGTLDPQIMSEIEMANLRVALPPSSEPENSGDSSTAQDRLLTGNAMLNGNGAHCAHAHKHPHQSFDLGAPRPRPVTGSGVVFRRKRTPCWCVLLVLVAVALLAAGISLGVLFGVLQTAESQKQAHAAVNRQNNSLNGSRGSNGASANNNDPNKNGKPDHDGTKMATDSPHSRPSSTLRTPSNPSGSVVTGGRDAAGRGWGVSVRRFKAYWHPGDSRVMEVLLSNGTILQATGHKKNDGTFQGLYSLSLTNGQDKTTRVRFMGGGSLGSVIHPDGTVVNLDWSPNDVDIECKVFQIPPPRGAPRGGPGRSAGVLTKPTSHLATLQLGKHSYLLRQISKTLNEASNAQVTEDDDTPSTPPPRYCAPRLPVKVTKCGGQYPYDGAFVQGEISLQTGPSLTVAALPWRKQDDDDICYSEFRDSHPNFFIPLPGHADRNTARYLAGKFWRTAARWWSKVCREIGSEPEAERDRTHVCSLMAASAQTQLNRYLNNIIHDSCTALLNSLQLACRTLDDLTARAAAAAVNRASSVSSSSSSSSSNSASAGARTGSRQPLTQSLLQRVLANATSLQEPATSEEQHIQVKTYAFCPSSQPQASFEKYINLRASTGGMSLQNITAADMVHVNCLGHPEVTYYYLGHKAAIAPLDRVKHRLKVCAVCAFEKTFSVHVQHDHMCCNDTCTRQSRCEDSVLEGRVGPGLRESHTFLQQNSVYCHEFLTQADSPARAISQNCVGSCQSNLKVRFQVKDSEVESSVSMDSASVYLDQELSCLEGYKTTCKSTFGH